MPNKNQKEISKEERELIIDGAKKQKEIDAKDKRKIKEVENEIFERSKQNLPELLEKQMNMVVENLEYELENVVGLKAPRIHKLISRQTYISTNHMVGYSGTELFIVYKAYMDLVDKINEITMYVPSIKSFCAFAGINTSTFKNYLQSPDEEKRNAAQMIDDYISDMLLDASKMRKTDAATSIFVAKSEHGMTEAVNPQTIIHTNKPDISSIMGKISDIRNGRVIDAEFKEK